MRTKYQPNPTPVPKTWVKAPEERWGLLDFLANMHLNPPADGRGREGLSASWLMARGVAIFWPKGFSWRNRIAWVDEPVLPRPFDRRCLHIADLPEVNNDDPER